MSCYHPMIGIPNGLTEKGKVHYKLISADSQVDLRSLKDGCVLIPCGKCIGCRLDYSRHWADRMMLELASCGSAVFVTLTYDDLHVPWKLDDAGNPIWQTLDKRDVQLFMKRLRKEFCDKKVRFYLSGEYGSNTLRPHYHAILFGLSLGDFCDRVVCGKGAQGDELFHSHLLDSIWRCGRCVLAGVSWSACAYVARYVNKKINRDDAWFECAGIEKEFSLMSRRPGIGALYLDQHPDALDYSKISLSTETGVKDISVPKYLVEKISLTQPDLYDKIKEQRKKAAEDAFELKLRSTDLSHDEFLCMQERIKKSQISILKREQFEY